MIALRGLIFLVDKFFQNELLKNFGPTCVC